MRTIKRCIRVCVILAIENGVCLLLNIMELNGICGAQSTKKHTFEKAQKQCLFPKIMTLLLKIIHRPCCEQFLNFIWAQ